MLKTFVLQFNFFILGIYINGTNKKKCNPSHLAHDNIKNLPDGDSPRQYPDESARVPGAGGHSPQEILGLQGIHRDLFLSNLCSFNPSEFFLLKLLLRQPMSMILLNPFLPVQTAAWVMGHRSCVISWSITAEANFDLCWRRGRGEDWEKFPTLQRSSKASRTQTQS
jgi:hypothetical protein